MHRRNKKGERLLRVDVVQQSRQLILLYSPLWHMDWAGCRFLCGTVAFHGV